VTPDYPTLAIINVDFDDWERLSPRLSGGVFPPRNLADSSSIGFLERPSQIENICSATMKLSSQNDSRSHF
jgi:hypothetical protein